MHSLSVMNAAGDIQTEILTTAQQLTMGEAYHHLVFGAARRSRMIWGAFRQLYDLILPDRNEPLPHDEVFEAARALNDIYIHTRGMVDNYAWTIRQLFGDADLKKLPPNDVSLFKNKFLNNASVSDFGDIASGFADWDSELKARRDPIAHRIPLSVPPALLNEDDQSKYVLLNEQYNTALSSYLQLVRDQSSKEETDAASEEVDRLLAAMAKIGTFVPMIVHDPKEGGVPIYPTVTEDIGQLIRLARLLNAQILKRLTK
jgi:hypothetical protein